MLEFIKELCLFLVMLWCVYAFSALIIFAAMPL